MKYRLATLYESRKEKMWAKVAEGMNVPWTEAEQNHWILGKKEMKKRAGDPDFRESWQKDYVALESKTNDDSNLAGLAPPLVDNAEDEVSAHEEQGRIQSVAWTGKEESSLFDLRAAGKCWNYISNLLPGRRRTVRSCMSHYRHVRDRAGGWSPELQTDLSRLYQIHKSEMWAELAEQLAVPWQSAEATHWILGSDYIGERAFLPQTVEPDQPAANPHELQPPNLTDSEPFDNSWATLILDRD
ncbi:hypothetical protein E4U11_007147 [Claviceps purpurea]|nr:hypothetical protein E4U11_007147 [Claviceps purpurea]